MPAPLICLITPGHLSSTPRLLKEADALVAAGYRVHVVAGRHYAPVDPLDEPISRAAQWALTRVDYRGGPLVFLRKLLRRLSRLAVKYRLPFTSEMAARAHHAESLHLGAVAAGVPADLYIGHCLAALPAAAFAAKARGTAYGFDVEDFHDAETESAAADPVERTVIQRLQREHLPGCRHLTAAAPLIAAKYRELYGVDPTVVLNVFPRAQAPLAPGEPKKDPAQPLRFYWFSQTVGPGRGLEAMVAVIGRMRLPAELQLRGFVSPAYAAELQAHAAQCGIRVPIRFLGPGPAAEMARLAAEADLGLSLETPPPLNRDVCLTNKIFIYLLAGIPQLLSHTAAQARLVPELGAAGLLCELGDTDRTALQLDEFFSDPARVASARTVASALAATQFCWDVEQENFLAQVARVVGPAAGTSAP